MKRIFPLINICLITAISFLSIDTLYTIFAAQLETVNRAKPANSEKTFNPANPIKVKSPPLSRYRTIVERDIFHTRNALKDAAEEKIVLENIKPTERDLKLWGTVVGNGSVSTYAIIEGPDAKSRRSRQVLYKPGDNIQGATIKKILREKVILSAEGQNEILRLVKPKSTGRSRRTQQGYLQRRNNQPIRQKRTLRRSHVQAALSDIDQLQSQAKIRSHSEGFQIYRIRRNSIFRRMGLRNGDIITAVGGRAITSVNDAYEIWRDLTAGRGTSVEFKRRGRRRIVDYRIR